MTCDQVEGTGSQQHLLIGMQYLSNDNDFGKLRVKDACQ